MSNQVTKDPKFSNQSDIQAENEGRKKSIEKFKKMSAAQIRGHIQCQLAADVARPRTPAPGEVLYVRAILLLGATDRKKLASLKMAANRLIYDFDRYDPDIKGRAIERRKTTDANKAKLAEIRRQITAIEGKGSDLLRAAVAKAANWACVPPALLAAILQNENSPAASGLRRGLQALERSLQASVGAGSTGLGNVKPATLKEASDVFKKYYKWSILPAGVKNVPQNKNAETDIYHAAAVLRNGLNRAWSAGSRSLNKALSTRYTFYPYFGGTVTKDVAIRAMGHYNGMGNAAMKYGKDAMNRITTQKLHFHPAKGK